MNSSFLYHAWGLYSCYVARLAELLFKILVKFVYVHAFR